MNDHKLQPCEKRTIYQGIRKLMVGAEGVVGGMSRMHKYSLGSRLCQRLEMLQETTLKAYQAVGNPLDAESLATLNSHLGLMRNTDTFKLRAALCRTATATPLLTADADNTKIIKL